MAANGQVNSPWAGRRQAPPLPVQPGANGSRRFHIATVWRWNAQRSGGGNGSGGCPADDGINSAPLADMYAPALQNQVGAAARKDRAGTAPCPWQAGPPLPKPSVSRTDTPVCPPVSGKEPSRQRPFPLLFFEVRRHREAVTGTELASKRGRVAQAQATERSSAHGEALQPARQAPESDIC